MELSTATGAASDTIQITISATTIPTSVNDIPGSKDVPGLERGWSVDKKIIIGSSVGGSLALITIAMLAVWGYIWRGRWKRVSQIDNHDPPATSPVATLVTGTSLCAGPGQQVIHEAPSAWRGSPTPTTYQPSPILPPPQELVGSPIGYKYD